MNRQVINNHIQGKPIKDGTWNISEPKSQRSLQLNKYYWGCLIKIFAGELGWSDDDMHDFCKDTFLQETEKQLIMGNEPIVLTKRKSTAKLTNIEFIDYCKKIQHFASTECDIYLPDPNEVEYDKIYQMYKRD